MHRAPVTDINIDTTLIESLRDPAAFPHAVSSIELVETHISWVLLTGDYVYKIKKPLNLGFLDFSTLERRRFFCEEEVRLNKPWAPAIYIDVVPISRIAGEVRVGDSSQVVEYAVRMHRFDQTMRLDAQLDAGKLTHDDMRELGAALAKRHKEAARVTHSKRTRTVQRAIELIKENFAPLQGEIDSALLEEIHRWTRGQLSDLAMLFGARFDAGFFRECHGDLHLGNLVRLPDGITTFDCIEFNDELRDIDVMADIAFLIMDLVARGELQLAACVLNRYLERSGDYEGMKVFNLYFTYRCLVRAKIAVIRSHEKPPGEGRAADICEAHRYCEIASRQIQKRRPALLLMTGLSGSGKTWVSSHLMAALPAIRVRSDIERKRKSGLDEMADSESDIGAGIYSEKASRDLYQHLNNVAKTLLDAGHNVILDAAFLKNSERTAAHLAADEANADFVIVQTTADERTLRERIRARNLHRNDASEAGVEVLDHQLRQVEDLDQEERRFAIRCESANFDAAGVVAAIQKRFCR